MTNQPSLGPTASNNSVLLDLPKNPNRLIKTINEDWPIFSKDKSYGRDHKRRGIVFYEINVDAIRVAKVLT